eukprot:UN10393
MNLWISFDDICVTNGCVKFIIDSEYLNDKIILNHDEYVENNDLKYSIEINETQYEINDKIICAEISKYSAMIFSGLVIHGSTPNRSNKRRCGVVYRFTVRDFTQTDNEQKYLRGNISYNPSSILVKQKCRLLNKKNQTRVKSINNVS